MSQNIFDPKLYKHVKSDKHSTTLQHKKGHTLTIAHNVISPKMRTALQALSKIPQEDATSSQAQESEDQHQYGKIIQKADGGEIPAHKQHAKEAQDWYRTAETHAKEAAKHYDTETQTPTSPEHEKHRKLAEHSQHQGNYHGSMAVITNPESRPNLVNNHKTRAEKSKQGIEATKPKYASGGGIGMITKFASMFADGGGVAGNDPDKAAAVANVERGSDQQQAPTAPNSRPANARPTQRSSYGDDSWPSPSQTSVGQALQSKAEGGPVKMAHGGGISESPAAPGSTSRGAYDAGLPCLNPNCKSHGSPHPNCRCYPNLAEGGTVNLRYCAHGKPHQPDCEYSTKGISEQGRDVRHGNRQADPQEVELSKHFAREEAKGRASDERHVKPKMQGLAEGGMPVPYGMRQEDFPQEQPQPEQKQQDLPTPEQPSMMLKEGMPGYEESKKPQAEDDDGGKTDQAMYDKIHGGDQYGRMPAQEAQYQQAQVKPVANDPGADTVQPGSDTVEMAQQQPDIPQPIDHKQEILQEDRAFQQDLMNGHITPKTYGDLMYHNSDGSEKSTLGKIGSIFGLILSGIGSGLTHQPNMAMQMMDNAIKNDLNSQMKSKENAQNFIHLNQQRLINEAQIPKLVAEGRLTQAQADLATTQAGKLSYEISNMQINRAALHKMANDVSMLPPGPQRQQAEAALAMVSDKVESENFNIADRAAAKQAMLHSVVTGSLLGNQAGANDGSSNKNQTRAMRMVGDDKLAKEADVMEKRRMGGIEGEASRDIDGKDRDAMEKHQQLNANLQDLKQSLAKLTTLNHYSPDYVTLTGKISKLQSDIRSSQLGTVYKPSEQQLLDATLKIPASKLTEYQTRSQVDQLLNSNNRDFNTLKKSYDLPVYKEGKDGKRYKESTVNGKTYYIPVK